jgi:hypothetical protein
VVEVHHSEAVQPVEAQHPEDGEVGHDQEQIEGGQGIEAAEGVVGQQEAQVALHRVRLHDHE